MTGEDILLAVVVSLVLVIALAIPLSVSAWEKADKKEREERSDRRGRAFDKAFERHSRGEIDEDEFDRQYEAAKRVR